MKVVVLGGGRSSEREVSRASAESVRLGLVGQGHEAIAVLIDPTGRWHQVDSFTDESNGAGQNIALSPGEGLLGADVVFPVLHGPFGEDGVTQGLLETLDVAYVGSGVAASAVCMDKLIFKDLMKTAGLAQVDYRPITADQWQLKRAGLTAQASELGFPLFVKPARLGSSVGISRVATPAELEPAIELALRHDPRVIAEAAAGGWEIECSVLGNRDLEVSELGKLEFDGEWYDYDAKYKEGGMRLVTPVPLHADIAINVKLLARQSFATAGCSGLARADFFVDAEGGEVLINELNTLPGFTQTSVYAKLFEASGRPYGELLDRLLELAIERFKLDRSFEY